MKPDLPNKVFKWIVLMENSLIGAAFCFIIVGSALGLASHGSEGANYVGEILFIVMAGMGLLVVLGLFGLSRKNDALSLQSGCDYALNGLAVIIEPSAIIYAVNAGDGRLGISPTLIYALIGLAAAYLFLYGIFFRRKALKRFLLVPFLLLIACFALYSYIANSLWITIGFSLSCAAALIGGCVYLLSALPRFASQPTIGGHSRSAAPNQEPSQGEDKPS